MERFWQDTFFSRITQDLMSKHTDLDLTAVYFRGTDTISHQFSSICGQPRLSEGGLRRKRRVRTGPAEKNRGQLLHFLSMPIGRWRTAQVAWPNTITFGDHRPR